MNNTKRIITVIIFIASFAIGWYHLRLAITAIFLFKNNEPLASWVCIVCGPLSTLPATIIGIFKRKIGGYWLIFGAIASTTALILPSPDGVLVFGWKVLLPMVVMGFLFLLLNQRNKITQTISDERPQNNCLHTDAE